MLKRDTAQPFVADDKLNKIQLQNQLSVADLQCID